MKGEFMDHFPPWTVVGLALAGFSAMLWGWTSLRREQCINLGTWVLFAGCILWGEVLRWFHWWLGL